MFIWMGRPFANDHPNGPAFCKWWSKWAGLLKWWSEWASLLQMIIRMGRPFANDDPNGPAFCKWWSEWASLLQMINRIGFLEQCVLVYKYNEKDKGGYEIALHTTSKMPSSMFCKLRDISPFWPWRCVWSSCCRRRGQPCGPWWSCRRRLKSRPQSPRPAWGCPGPPQCLPGSCSISGRTGQKSSQVGSMFCILKPLPFCCWSLEAVCGDYRLRAGTMSPPLVH